MLGRFLHPYGQCGLDVISLLTHNLLDLSPTEQTLLLTRSLSLLILFTLEWNSACRPLSAFFLFPPCSHISSCHLIGVCCLMYYVPSAMIIICTLLLQGGQFILFLSQNLLAEIINKWTPCLHLWMWIHSQSSMQYVLLLSSLPVVAMPRLWTEYITADWAADICSMLRWPQSRCHI